MKIQAIEPQFVGTGLCTNCTKRDAVYVTIDQHTRYGVPETTVTGYCTLHAILVAKQNGLTLPIPKIEADTKWGQKI
jgi:hypothetical protein